MNTIINSDSHVGNALYSLLPQNEHTQKKIEIENEIKDLNALLLSGTTSEVFNKVITQTKKSLEEEKVKCIASIATLNGKFFEDSNSLLKQAWDLIISLIGIQTRDQLDDVEKKLKEDPNQADKKVKGALLAITRYKARENRRNILQKKLALIISTEKNEPASSFKTEQKTLQARQLQLCGQYYADPSGELDIAWKKYVVALSSGSSDANNLLTAFNLLDEERKTIDSKFNDLQLKIATKADPARTYETLAKATISKQIEALETLKNQETSLAGVDWKKTVNNACTVAFLSLAYIATQTIIN